MTTVQGTNIHCGIINTATNVFTQFAFSKKASITMNRAMQEFSSPTSGQWKEYIPARKGWKMSVGCLLANDETTVWNAYDNGTKIKVSWREASPDWSSQKGKEFTGYAYITNIKGTGNIHEMATFDVELQGTGALTYREWSENVQILRQSVYDHGYTSYHFKLDNPCPCDLIIASTDGEVECCIKKGETECYSPTASRSSSDLYIKAQAVANYNFSIVG